MVSIIVVTFGLSKPGSNGTEYSLNRLLIPVVEMGIRSKQPLQYGVIQQPPVPTAIHALQWSHGRDKWTYTGTETDRQQTYIPHPVSSNVRARG
jgi:hypothetical protein